MIAKENAVTVIYTVTVNLTTIQTGKKTGEKHLIIIYQAIFQTLIISLS